MLLRIYALPYPMHMSLLCHHYFYIAKNNFLCIAFYVFLFVQLMYLFSFSGNNLSLRFTRGWFTILALVVVVVVRNGSTLL